MNDNLSVSEIISKSFSYIFNDIKKIFRESFFTVLLLTIIFNGLYFLVLKNIATKFTFFIIFALMGLVISTIAYKVHRDILLNQTVFNPLIKMFDLSNIRYLIYSTLISSLALSPVFLKYYLDRNEINTLFGADSRYVVLLLIPTIYLAFKLILILPKVSLNKSISIFTGKEWLRLDLVENACFNDDHFTFVPLILLLIALPIGMIDQVFQVIRIKCTQNTIKIAPLR